MFGKNNIGKGLKNNTNISTKKLFNFFNSKFLNTNIKLENHNKSNINKLYNLSSLIQGHNTIYTNGKYYIVGDNYLFHKYSNQDDLNTLNTNVLDIKLNKLLDVKGLGLSEIYKYFTHIDNKEFFTEQKINNLSFSKLEDNFNFDKARGNIFEFSKGGNKYKMFGYSVPVDKIPLFNTYMDLPYITVAEINMYNPEIFILESLLYFYEKNKGVFIGERIKLVNYIKSIGINLENISINLKHDKYLRDKITKMTKNDVFYKYNLLLQKEIGTVGNVFINIYVFMLDEGKYLTPVIPTFMGDEIILLGGKFDKMVYIDYLKRYNDRLPQTTYNHSLWFNYMGIQEDVHFYTYEQIENIINFLKNKR